MNTRKMRMATLMLTAGLSGAAQAALHDRGGGLIYDDATDVTWLQDASHMTANGERFFYASILASELVYYDTARERSWQDWRLPRPEEFASLWSNGVRGGTASASFPFINLQAGPYWGWDYVQPYPNSSKYSGNWDFATGGWFAINGGEYLYSWALRSGDVGPAPIPEPETYAMMLAGLGLVGATARRRHS